MDFTVSDGLCKKWVNIELVVINELGAFPLLGHEPWIHSKVGLQVAMGMYEQPVVSACWNSFPDH